MGPSKKALQIASEASELDLEGEPPTLGERRDADIARAVRHALAWDVLVPHERIRTSVSNGVVTLEGTVDYLSQYHDAARVRDLPGVRAVNNLIAVDPLLPRLVPLTIRSVVELALQRCGDDAARRVQIAVVAGKVTLSGDVPSLAERSAVEAAVCATPGVLKVDNFLGVQPPCKSAPSTMRSAALPDGGSEAGTSAAGE
jgi:osmotically-inducible protein OsmY